MARFYGQNIEITELAMARFYGQNIEITLNQCHVYIHPFFISCIPTNTKCTIILIFTMMGE